MKKILVSAVLAMAFFLALNFSPAQAGAWDVFSGCSLDDEAIRSQGNPDKYSGTCLFAARVREGKEVKAFSSVESVERDMTNPALRRIHLSNGDVIPLAFYSVGGGIRRPVRINGLPGYRYIQAGGMVVYLLEGKFSVSLTQAAADNP